MTQGTVIPKTRYYYGVVLSAALSAVFGIQWVRSNCWQDVIAWSNGHFWRFASENNHISLIYASVLPNERLAVKSGFFVNFNRELPPVGLWDLFYPDCQTRLHGLGFWIGWEKKEPLVVFVVPYWFTTGLTAMITLLCMRSHLRIRRRIQLNHCQKCGYNLTGNITGVCSECGMPILRQVTMAP